MLATARKTAIARPLKVLTPLIQREITEGNKAGIEHYRQAGEMLLEARDQIAGHRWASWLNKNFELSRSTANKYMRLVEIATNGDLKEGATLEEALGHKESREARDKAWRSVHHATAQVNTSRLNQERQARDKEVELHRALALELIDIGFKALATRLHPDRGGSRDAMSRLNTVRAELNTVAKTRRFM